jgi:UMF1 family MFS transporter
MPRTICPPRAIREIDHPSLVSVLGHFMTSALHFFVLAGVVGLVRGGVQALSRSLFASMIPRDRSSELFGLRRACRRSAA